MNDVQKNSLAEYEQDVRKYGLDGSWDSLFSAVATELCKAKFNMPLAAKRYTCIAKNPCDNAFTLEIMEDGKTTKTLMITLATQHFGSGLSEMPNSSFVFDPVSFGPSGPVETFLKTSHIPTASLLVKEFVKASVNHMKNLCIYLALRGRENPVQK